MKITFCKIENGTGIAKYSFICFVRHEKLLPCIKTNFYLSLFHQNQGVVGQGGLSTNRTFLRYGILPRENLCTENLTPWKKLLPCKNRRGLAVLLSSGHMQKYSVYFSIGLELKPVCSTADCSKVFIQYKHNMNNLMTNLYNQENKIKMTWFSWKPPIQAKFLKLQSLCWTLIFIIHKVNIIDF